MFTVRRITNDSLNPLFGFNYSNSPLNSARREGGEDCLNPLFGFNYSNLEELHLDTIVFVKSLNPLFGFNYSNWFKLKTWFFNLLIKVSIPYLVLITQTKMLQSSLARTTGKSLNPLFGFNYSNFFSLYFLSCLKVICLNPLFGFNYSNQEPSFLQSNSARRVSIPYLVLITQTRIGYFLCQADYRKSLNPLFGFNYSNLARR